MMMSEVVPYWCSESSITNTQVAIPCPHVADQFREPLNRAAQLFRVATDNFIVWTGQKQPLLVGGLDYSQHSAWLSTTGQLVERYRASHWELINNDDDYQRALGEAYDDYNRLKGHTVPRQTDRARRKRQLLECHHMVKVAVREGLATSMAAFAVVPEVVVLRRPVQTVPDQINTALKILPAAKELSRHLARHSKKGNDTLLRALAKVSRPGKIDYQKLCFKPDLLDITDTSTPSLYTVQASKEPEDLEIMFRGCPALIGGSIARLNNFLATTIINEHCYEKALVAQRLDYVS